MADTQIPASITVKSILNTYNTVMSRVPYDPVLLNQNTLNYLYDVYPNIVSTTIPKLKYMGIGIGGRYLASTQETIRTPPVVPTKEELNLYTPIPFRCRPLDEDLSDSERAQYRMRVLKDVKGNGVIYACYYLKEITYRETSPQIYKLQNGVLLPYDIENRFLTPVPNIPQTGGVQATEEPIIIVGIQASCTLTADEVYEYINVKYNGDQLMAVISEWGIYSGEDQVVDGIGYNGAVLRYSEAMVASMEYKVTTSGSAVTESSWTRTQSFILGDGIGFLTE